MEKKIDRRILVTKQLLRNALIELLHEKDIYRISIRELCERANVNRSTFYKYYGSQFDLLEEMEDEMVSIIENNIDPNCNAEQCVIAICRYIEQNPEQTRLLINSNVNPGFTEKFFRKTTLRQTIDWSFSDHFDESQLDYIYGFVIHGSLQIIRTWINKEERESPEEIGRLFRKMFETETTFL